MTLTRTLVSIAWLSRYQRDFLNEVPLVLLWYAFHISGNLDICTADSTPTSQMRPATERTVKAPLEKPKKKISSPGA